VTICLERRAINLHHPSLRAKRGNPDSGAAGLPRFARNDDSYLLHCALKSSCSCPSLTVFSPHRNQHRYFLAFPAAEPAADDVPVESWSDSSSICLIVASVVASADRSRADARLSKVVSSVSPPELWHPLNRVSKTAMRGRGANLTCADLPSNSPVNWQRDRARLSTL
jgi:hypothetical protein